ncbi:MAG: hypothetical protein LBT91_00705, partial [Bifidobacteriaceae bacterium]|nr:hypothetical protein [Bifidobacteriaceae bacterium]
MAKTDKRRSPLVQLAQKYNIGTFFIGPKNKYIEISENNLQLILKSFGVDTSGAESIEEALADVNIKNWRRPIASTIHKVQNKAIQFDFYIPKGNIAIVILELESGKKQELYRIDSGKYDDTKIVDGKQICHIVKKFADNIEMGYHKIVVEINGQ